MGGRALLLEGRGETTRGHRSVGGGAAPGTEAGASRASPSRMASSFRQQL